MAKIRIYELARDLGVESSDVLEKALGLGLAVKTASSGLDEADVALVKLALVGGPAEAEAAGTPEPEVVPESIAVDLEIVTVSSSITVAEFAEAVGRPVGDVVKALLVRGRPVGAGGFMPEELMETVGESFGVMIDTEEPAAVEPAVIATRPVFDDKAADMKLRPPVVTVMGHVDHGKTTLLDAIRKTHVVSGEQGGITQHIGAYQVKIGGNAITFIDTPGHAAFSTMRARGAEVTDIVVLVVAADDGVMPQTVEAISHAKAAGVQLVVAVNKMDLPGADPLRVRTMLTTHGVVVEGLGGDVPSVELSAVTGDGIDNLLEVIDLIAQLYEFKANPNTTASGFVIESQLEQGRGPTATVIIQRGTLHQGDSFVAGTVPGRVRAMMDHDGNRLTEATPSMPVLIMGWSDVPMAGDAFEVVASDKDAKTLAGERSQTIKDRDQVLPTATERLQGLLEQLRSEDTELRVVLKADAHGSVEALRDSIAKITRADGRIEVVHAAVGGINENDVTLAEVTGAIIVGFNVRPEGKARQAAEAAGIEIRTYGIIYELLEELEGILVGRLEPDKAEFVLGSAEVRALFKVPRAGTVAGCYVTEGVVQRNGRIRLIRGGVVVHTGVMGSLRRFKEDVREVATGFECGISIDGFNDVKESDVIEVFEVREVART